MKNRLYWFLILVFVIFIAFFYLISRDKSKNNSLETKTWVVVEKKQEIIFLKENSIDEVESNSWKIEDIKERASNFAYFNLDSNKFYFNIIWDKLELKLNSEHLWFFEVVLKNDINVSKILWEKDLFLVEIWENKYIYSKNNWFIKHFETKLTITYSKFSDSDFVFFSEQKGAFILAKSKNNLEYFPIFSDFIFYKSAYIWIISSSDEEKKSRFKLSWNKNFVLYYNPKTQETKLIYDLDFLPKKIWQENKKIFLENWNWEKFSLENY